MITGCFLSIVATLGYTYHVNLLVQGLSHGPIVWAPNLHPNAYHFFPYRPVEQAPSESKGSTTRAHRKTLKNLAFQVALNALDHKVRPRPETEQPEATGRWSPPHPGTKYHTSRRSAKRRRVWAGLPIFRGFAGTVGALIIPNIIVQYSQYSHSHSIRYLDGSSKGC